VIVISITAERRNYEHTADLGRVGSYANGASHQ